MFSLCPYLAKAGVLNGYAISRDLNADLEA